MELTANDQNILSIVKKKKCIPSIKDLLSDVSLKYGGIYYIVRKLEKERLIVVKNYYDPESGVEKMGIFIDQDACDKFFATRKIDAKSDKVKIPQFYFKVHDLFALMMGTNELVDKIAIESGVDGEKNQNYVLRLITDGLGISIEEIDELEKEAMSFRKEYEKRGEESV